MPEETATTIKIPLPGEEGRHKGHEIRTIVISEDDGIKALYCVSCEKVMTYIFSKDKGWTMEKAQRWVQEHSEKISFSHPRVTDEHVLWKARHRRDQCMMCTKAPEVEVLWADGRGRAWFCMDCFKKWSEEDEREIVAQREVVDGEVPRKWSEGKRAVLPPGTLELDVLSDENEIERVQWHSKQVGSEGGEIQWEKQASVLS